MLCPYRSSTLRAHQPHQQRPVATATTRGRALSPTTTTSTTTTTTARASPLLRLRNARRRPSEVVAASAVDGSAERAGPSRGDGVIPSAAAAAASSAPAASSSLLPAAAAATTATTTTAATATATTPATPSPPSPDVVIPPDILIEFEHKLQGDLKAVGVTIAAVSGVIVYWRGVWSLLDHMLGDSVFGDVCCIAMGLLTVLGIRLSGAKMSSFWPTS